MQRLYFVILYFLFSVQLLLGQTRVPAFFGDNMVLQQQQLVRIWGTDNPGTRVRVKGSWGSASETITDSQGQWKLKLQTPVAGGPFTLTVRGSQSIILQNILVGEVWFCAGQSNMEMPVKGYANQPVRGSNETILSSTNDQVRFLQTPRSVSITALTDVKSEWKSSSPATTGNFSATAYYFARKIQSQLNVPVGIIQSAWGGSAIESWMDPESLSGFENVTIPRVLPEKDPNKTPTILYNGLVHPYIGFTIRGMLWYQGEANRGNAHEYLPLFSSMIASWRKKWDQGEFPFYYVQIAPFAPGTVNAAYLREAQLKAMRSVRNTGMVVTLDIGEQDIIHPSRKEEVGNRLAYWALVNDYQVKGIACSGPVYKNMEKTTDHKIRVYFDYCEQGLSSFGEPLTDFEVAGPDQVFFPATAKIVNERTDCVLVWNDAVKDPVSVRYAFKNWTRGSLFNTRGLPASSFRTDNW